VGGLASQAVVVLSSLPMPVFPMRIPLFRVVENKSPSFDVAQSGRKTSFFLRLRNALSCPFRAHSVRAGRFERSLPLHTFLVGNRRDWLAGGWPFKFVFAPDGTAGYRGREKRRFTVRRFIAFICVTEWRHNRSQPCVVRHWRGSIRRQGLTQYVFLARSMTVPGGKEISGSAQPRQPRPFPSCAAATVRI
jgi:hypothetical protein